MLKTADCFSASSGPLPVRQLPQLHLDRCWVEVWWGGKSEVALSKLTYGFHIAVSSGPVQPQVSAVGELCSLHSGAGSRHCRDTQKAGYKVTAHAGVLFIKKLTYINFSFAKHGPCASPDAAF